MDRCKREVKARGLCLAHYQRLMRHGDTGGARVAGPDESKVPPPPERLGLALKAPVPCAAYPDLFDPSVQGERTWQRDNRIRAAAEICRTCPALAPCSRLVAEVQLSAPRHGAGVWGGYWVRREGKVDLLAA